MGREVGRLNMREGKWLLLEGDVEVSFLEVGCERG
jgi:hypothetical protein